MYIDNNTPLEILQDTNLKGKEIDWKNKKLKNLAISDSFKRLKLYRKAQRLNECGTILKFNECEKDDYKKLIRANFCHERLCPVCNWRKSILLQHQLKEIIFEIEKKQKVEYLFLTLTIPNSKDINLSNDLDNIYKGFYKLFKYKRISDMSVGYVRTLEITRNTDKKSENYNTYHAHFHVLLAVKPSYFKDETYISQNEFANLWKKALKVNYTPIVHVEKVKSKSKKQDILSAILEVAKYSVKDTDYICESEEETDEVIKTLSTALKGRRLIGFGKMFKDVRAELKLQDIEDENSDLIVHENKECHCPKCGGVLNNVVYGWKNAYKNYFKLDLSADEIDCFFNQSYLYRFKKEKIKKE